MTHKRSSLDKFLQFFSSLKFGLWLLGLLATAMILGTFILQRPMAQEGQIEQVYAPQVVSLLNALGLFDVFHAGWFFLLLGLLGANITLASIERFPQIWRLYARPHFLADAAFVRALPFQREIPLGPHASNEAMDLAAAKLARRGYPPRREILSHGTLYVEKHRLARLAPYIVHASLLTIFAGAMIDGTRGYKGFVSLRAGASTDVVEPLTMPGPDRRLDFTLRCDATGMDAYADGSPRQYWSQLAVVENGRVVAQKRIHVNDPLTYKGVRFFQASYTPSGTPRRLVMEASWTENGAERRQKLTLVPGQPAPLGEQGVQVALVHFLPDFVLNGNEISSRSMEPRNPAIHLQVGRPGIGVSDAWVMPKSPEIAPPNNSGISFSMVSVEMDATTGLQVAHEPGQWLIWAGCLFLTAGLMLALYFSHIRIWGVAAKDARGQSILLLGGQPSKYRENFEQKFNELTGEVAAALTEAGSEKTEKPQAA